MRTPAWLGSGMPLLFVLLWSTGFLGAKFGLPYAEPFTFLAIRLLLAAALLAAFALLSGAPWPGSARLAGHVAVAGLLVHGLYLGGVFLAIEHGMSAGLTSLLVGLQPLATAALAGIWLGEQVSRRQWLGLALGLAGVALVVLGRIHGGADGLAWAAVLVALAAITCGTLYQKRFCGGMDLRTGGVVQYLASGACSASPRCFSKAARCSGARRSC